MRESFTLQAPFRIVTISFNELKNFWIEAEHFKGTDSKAGEYVNTLGPYISDFEKPPYKAFGLFKSNELIGVTQIVHWNRQWVRYRTLNIKPEHRGRDLGLQLLKEAHRLSWPDLDIFGWTRISHFKWSQKVGFRPLDNIWYKDHIAMVLDRNLLLDSSEPH